LEKRMSCRLGRSA